MPGGCGCVGELWVSGGLCVPGGCGCVGELWVPSHEDGAWLPMWQKLTQDCGVCLGF